MSCVVAIAVAALLIQTFGSRGIPQLGSWVNELLGKEVTIGSLIEHLFFIGHYDTTRYDFVIWSLVQEMRISLIFPALLAVVLWIPWKWALASALALSAVSMVVYRWVYLAGYSLLGTYPITGHCLLFFVIGILLATHREAISAWYGQLNTRHRAVLAIAGIVSYSCLPQIPHLLGVKNGGPSAWLATPGVVVMIFALASPRAGRLLRLSIPSFLGRVSYSLYLYHGIVILAALNIGYGRVPIGVLILLMFMASLAVSTLSYYWIEVPAMALGARLSRRLDRSKNQMTGEAIPQRP